jgi:hypothetical protein
MPHSGIAFVRGARGAHDAHLFFTILFREKVMCIEKYIRNLGFALAAVGVVFGAGYTLEYLPMVNALVR